ncbi:MAG: anti-sigma factor family protein [Bacillota bacterium]|jgi:hypothetical protein
MNCKKVQDLLSPYLDQVLSEEENNLIEKHLEKCSSCQQELTNLKNALSMIQTLPELPLPENFQVDLRRKLAAVKHGDEEVKKKGWLIIFPYRWASLSMAAVLLLVLYSFMSPLLPKLEKQSDISAPNDVLNTKIARFAAEDSLAKEKSPIPDMAGEADINSADKDTAAGEIVVYHRQETSIQKELVQDKGNPAGEAEKAPENAPKIGIQSMEDSPENNNEIINNENNDPVEVQRKGEANRSKMYIAGINPVGTEQNWDGGEENTITEPSVMEFKINTNNFEELLKRIGDYSGEISQEKDTYIVTVTQDKLPQVLSEIKAAESVNAEVYGYTLLKIIIKE